MDLITPLFTILFLFVVHPLYALLSSRRLVVPLDYNFEGEFFPTDFKIVANTSNGHYWWDGDEYNGKKAYNGIYDTTGDKRWIYWTGSQWQIHSKLGSLSFYDYCTESAINRCNWLRYCFKTGRVSNEYIISHNPFNNNSYFHDQTNNSFLYYGPATQNWIESDTLGSSQSINTCNTSSIWWCRIPDTGSIEAIPCNGKRNVDDISSENYILVQQQLSPADADNYCQQTYGTSLASIHNWKENEEVTKLCNSSTVYGIRTCTIGLNDNDIEDKWIWTDGSIYNYSNWHVGEPNDGGVGEDCVEIRPLDGFWNDLPCEGGLGGEWSVQKFVCNKPTNSSSTITPATTKSATTTQFTTSTTSLAHTTHEDMMYGLQCNGVETNMSGIIEATPAGVCINEDMSSYMLTCKGNIMQADIYLSKYCAGYSRKVPADSIFSSDFFDNVNMVCDMDACEYINVTIYNDTFDDISECQQYDRQTAAFEQHIYVKNYCNSMWFSSTTKQCDDGSLTIISYFDNTQCIDNHDGETSTDDLDVGSNQCISDTSKLDAFTDIPDGKIAAVDISCGVAASTISENSTSTTAPKSTPNWSNGLQCNGIETKSDVITAIPAGVCVSESMTSSYKLKCTSNTMEYFSYSSADCSGYSKLLPITTVFSSDKYDDFNIVCDMNPCKYTSITGYNITFNNTDECETFDHKTTPFTQEIYIEDYCNSIIGYQSDKVGYCNNQYVTMTAYFGDDKCIGSGDIHDVKFNVGEGECVSNNTMNGEVIVIDVLCGVAESDTTTTKQVSIWVIILVILIFFIIFIVVVVYIRCKQKLKRWRGMGMLNIAVEFNKFTNDDSTQNN